MFSFQSFSRSQVELGNALGEALPRAVTRRRAFRSCVSKAEPCNEFTETLR